MGRPLPHAAGAVGAEPQLRAGLCGTDYRVRAHFIRKRDLSATLPQRFSKLGATRAT